MFEYHNQEKMKLYIYQNETMDSPCTNTKINTWYKHISQQLIINISSQIQCSAVTEMGEDTCRCTANIRVDRGQNHNLQNIETLTYNSNWHTKIHH